MIPGLTSQKPLITPIFSSFKIILRNIIILRIKPFILYHGRTQTIIIFIPNWLLNSIAVAREINVLSEIKPFEMFTGTF